MIQSASTVLSDRWSKASFVLVLAACIFAFAMKPAKRGRVVVTDTTITILDNVTFVGDTISTPSLRTLDAIADTLIGNPSIQLVEVQSSSLEHTQACVDYLIGQGVDAARLEAAHMPERTSIGFLIVRRASDEPLTPEEIEASEPPRIPAKYDSIF